ncbi:MAG: hypothetical protein ACYS0I_21265, partial [Planctomycetota bacterium]|jgi:hypothetical protein
VVELNWSSGLTIRPWANMLLLLCQAIIIWRLGTPYRQFVVAVRQPVEVTLEGHATRKFKNPLTSQ